MSDSAATRRSIRAIERIDGAPWIDTAITPAHRMGSTYKMTSIRDFELVR